MDELAFELLEYEKSGCINEKAYIVNEIIKPYLIRDLDKYELVELYNEYLEDVHYYDDHIYIFDEDFFTTYFNNNPYEAVRSAHFGNIESWNDDFIRFNGYGNLESLSSYQLQEEIIKDTNFLNWLFDNDVVEYDGDEIDEAVQVAYELIEKGY